MTFPNTKLLSIVRDGSENFEIMLTLKYRFFSSGINAISDTCEMSIQKKERDLLNETILVLLKRQLFIPQMSKQRSRQFYRKYTKQLLVHLVKTRTMVQKEKRRKVESSFVAYSLSRLWNGC
ncbi:hypothetical protein BLNAU_7916 [Blattamonas nauphoetae]|uniref:Uncharacterized protein n=1 Tax=Blattamonas nauphoetae TaxID=2049346 RepID=A0ABQ9Y016_9EUKA|nr:hypothetical protein BLNAU_7916 [Blattamonas nauphoetae]